MTRHPPFDPLSSTDATVSVNPYFQYASRGGPVRASWVSRKERTSGEETIPSNQCVWFGTSCRLRQEIEEGTQDGQSTSAQVIHTRPI